jgi:hypothetical protein
VLFENEEADQCPENNENNGNTMQHGLYGRTFCSNCANLASDRTIAIALAAIAAVYCALFLYFVERASIRVPVYDLLDMLQFYADRLQANDWVGYLWTPHNEHRIVWGRLLLAIDVKWFGGAGTPFALFGFFLLIAMIILVSYEILKSNFFILWKATAVPIAIILLTPASTVDMIGMPAMGGLLYTPAFALFAVLLLDGANEQGRFSTYRRIAAIGAACLAAFGISGGLLIWPVLMWSAWRGVLGWGWIATIACAGGLFSTLYVWGMPSSTIAISFDMGHLVRTLDYAIRLLGLPWSHMPQLVWPARLIGAGLGCVGGVLLINDCRLACCTTRLKRVGLALVLFTFLVAAAVAIARVDIATDREMPIRYAMLIVLAHVGLLLYSLAFLERVWHGAFRRSIQGLTLVVSVALVVQQIVIGRFAVQEADRYKDAWSRFVAGEWTPDMLHYVYPDRNHAKEGLAYLRKMQIITSGE